MAFQVENQVVRERVTKLIGRFEFYVKEFDNNPPFSSEQRDAHLHTIRLRRNAGTVAGALRDEMFLKSLYGTLKLWRIGTRESKLVPFQKFVDALQLRVDDLSKLDGARLDETLAVAVVGAEISRIIENLEIVENKSRIVPGTKCLHHLLPDLVPPMDREYTQTFFGWESGFQNHPSEWFQFAFRSFAEIAVKVLPESYISGLWRSSGPKILDNAVVSFCRVEGLQTSRKKSQLKQREKQKIFKARALATPATKPGFANLWEQLNAEAFLAAKKELAAGEVEIQDEEE